MQTGVTKKLRRTINHSFGRTAAGHPSLVIFHAARGRQAIGAAAWLAASAFVSSCSGPSEVDPRANEVFSFEMKDEPRRSAGATSVTLSARASIETPPLFDDEEGGNANGDDPAIWVHPTTPDKSLVLVTQKEAGLAVYDLTGKEVQHIAAPPSSGEDDSPGRFNNVDIIRGFDLGTRRVDVAVVTDRGHDTLRFYAIDPRAQAS